MITRLLVAGLLMAAVPAAVPAAAPTTVPVGGPSPAPVAVTATAVPVRYSAPVQPVHVVRAFDPPSGPYGPGHRGVDLATTAGQVIRAAADGTVTFAGQVAGRGVVVVAHPDGIRTEYEPLDPLVHAGEAVARGSPIGHVAGTHGSCVPGGCVHWGARRDEVYLDPLSLLRALGPVRLLPWSPARDP